MVAALASEYGLATLVGTKTAGLLVATSAFSMNARVDAASDSRTGSGG
jgi:C-terminal processing protease CtpA/Prc